MRILRAVFAIVVLFGLLVVPSAAEAATDLEVRVYGSQREHARSAVNVTTYAKQKVSTVSVELTVDGRPVVLEGYKNTSSSSSVDWPHTQYWSNGVEVERPLADIQAKVSVTYESGSTVVVERVLPPLVTPQITDLAYTPTEVGVSHGPVTFTGLVTYKKNATETVPAPGAKVRVYSDGFNSTTVSTGDDGRFSLTTYVHDSGRPDVFVLGERPYTSTYVTGAKSINMTYAPTRLTWSVPDQDNLWVGNSLEISGLLEWQSPTGWQPLSRAQYVRIHCFDGANEQVVYLQTEQDGTFRKTFVPEKACRLYVMFSTSDMFKPSNGSQILSVRQHAAFTGLTWPKSPVVQGVAFSLKGTHIGLPGNTRLTNGYAELFFSRDAKTWQKVGGQARPDANGVITPTASAWADGYWKLEVKGPNIEQVTLTSPLITVRRRARISTFDAAPEPIRKGKWFTVRGTLINHYNGEPLRSQKVHLYFLPKGSKTWKWAAVVTTGPKGGFSKAFKASRDGSWRARYWGDALCIGVTSWSDYVDVR